MSQFILTEQKEEALQTENFLNWFGKSKVCDSENIPKIVFHGTTYDISTFDPDVGNIENYFGKGIYATDSLIDVENNYASLDGPDLQAKIMHSQDTLVNLDKDEYLELLEEHSIKYAEDEDIYSEEIILELAQKMHTGENRGLTIPLYLSMQNPVIIDKYAGTELTCDYKVDEDFIHLTDFLERFFDNTENTEGESIDGAALISNLNDNFIEGEICDSNDAIEKIIELLEDELLDEDTLTVINDRLKDSIYELHGVDEDGPLLYDNEIEFHGSLVDFYDSLESILNEHGVPDTADIIASTQENTLTYYHPDVEVNVYSIFKDLHQGECGSNIIDYIPIGQAFRLAFEKMGYDGIIMSAHQLLQNMTMDHDANHYIAFNSNQCKSALGNNGDYSKYHNDICARISTFRSEQRISDKEALLTTLKLNKKFNNRVNFQITNTEDAPDSILNELDQRDVDLSTVKGYMKSKTCYLFIDNIIDREDLEKTCLHEAFHLGIRSLLGHRVKDVYPQIFSYLKKNDPELLYNVSKEYNLDLSKRKDQFIAVEEGLASMSERGIPTQVSTIIIGAVRSFCRHLNIDLEINKTDVDYLISRSFKEASKEEPKGEHSKPKRLKI